MTNTYATRTTGRVTIEGPYEVVTSDSDPHARSVYDAATGHYLGTVIYTERRRKAPAGSPSSTGRVTDHGWRPEKQTRAPLTDRRAACDRLAATFDARYPNARQEQP